MSRGEGGGGLECKGWYSEWRPCDVLVFELCDVSMEHVYVCVHVLYMLIGVHMNCINVRVCVLYVPESQDM